MCCRKHAVAKGVDLKRFFSAAITAAAILGCVSAQASLVQRQNTTLDTETGLEWLNVQLPSGYGYNAVGAGAGGWIPAGWRYAWFDEVVALAERYVGPIDGGYSGPTSALSTNYATAAESFVLTMGMNLAFNDARASYNLQVYPGLRQISTQGMFRDRNSADGRVGIFEVTAVLEDAAGLYGAPESFRPFGRWLAVEDFWSDSFASSPISSLLVRETESTVPEPGTAVLVSIAFFGLAVSMKGAARKRRHA